MKLNLLTAKTIFIENKIFAEEKKKKKIMIILMKHDKFTDSNARRKLKSIIFIYLLKYIINKHIKIKYNGKIGNEIFKKELQILNQAQIANSSITFNKELLK